MEFRRTHYLDKEPRTSLDIAGENIVIGSDVYDVFHPALRNNEVAYSKWIADQPGNEELQPLDCIMKSLNNQRAIMSIELPGDRTMVLSRGHFFPAAIEVFGSDAERQKAVYNVGHIWNILPHETDEGLVYLGLGISNGVLPQEDRTYDNQLNPPMFFVLRDADLKADPEVSMLLNYGASQERKHPLTSARGRLLSANNDYPDWKSLTVVNGEARMSFANAPVETFGVCIDDFLEGPEGLIVDPMFNFKEDEQ